MRLKSNCLLNLSFVISLISGMPAWGDDKIPTEAECEGFLDAAQVGYEAYLWNRALGGVYEREVESGRQVITGLFRAVEERADFTEILQSPQELSKALRTEFAKAKGVQDSVNCDKGTFSKLGSNRLSESSVSCSSPPASSRTLAAYGNVDFIEFKPNRICIFGAPDELAGRLERGKSFYNVCFSVDLGSDEIWTKIFDSSSAKYYQNKKNFMDSSPLVAGLQQNKRAQYFSEEEFADDYLRTRGCAKMVQHVRPASKPKKIISAPPAQAARATPVKTLATLSTSQVPYSDATKALEITLSKMKTPSSGSSDPVVCAALCVDVSSPTFNARSVIKTGYVMRVLLEGLKTACKKNELLFPRGLSLINANQSSATLLVQEDSCFERGGVRPKVTAQTSAPAKKAVPAGRDSSRSSGTGGSQTDWVCPRRGPLCSVGRRDFRHGKQGQRH